jgi:YcxB-like protein
VPGGPGGGAEREAGLTQEKPEGVQIDFTCSLMAEDFVEAYRLHMKRRPQRTSAGLILFLCGLVLVWVVSKFSTEEVGYTLLAIACGLLGALLLCYSLIYSPRFARQAYAHNKSMHGLIRVLVDDAGIQLHTDYMNLLQPWAHFVSWKENRNLFLLYESGLVFSLVFPKRCMDEASIEGLRGILTSKVSPAA